MQFSIINILAKILIFNFYNFRDKRTHNERQNAEFYSPIEERKENKKHRRQVSSRDYDDHHYEFHLKSKAKLGYKYDDESIPMQSEINDTDLLERSENFDRR